MLIGNLNYCGWIDVSLSWDKTWLQIIYDDLLITYTPVMFLNLYAEEEESIQCIFTIEVPFCNLFNVFLNLC